MSLDISVKIRRESDLVKRMVSVEVWGWKRL